MDLENLLKQNPALFEGAGILSSGRDTDCTTEKYSESDDAGAVEAFNAAGWRINSYYQKRARRSDKAPFRTYLAYYDNPLMPEIPNKGRIELAQSGSRDGTRSLRMLLSFKRAGYNNLRFIVSKNVIAPERLVHLGRTPKQLADMVAHITNATQVLYDRIKKMLAIPMTQAQALDFATRGAMIRLGKENKYAIAPDRLLVGLNFNQQVLALNPTTDTNTVTLFDVFSVVQDYLINSAEHVRMTSKDGKNRKCRAIKSIEETLRISQALWDLAEQYVV